MLFNSHQGRKPLNGYPPEGSGDIRIVLRETVSSVLDALPMYFLLLFTTLGFSYIPVLTFFELRELLKR